MPTFSSVWVLGYTALVIAIYRYLIYPVFLSPISKIPNAHFTAAVLPAWIWYKRWTKTESRSIYAAHVKHGSIVKLGPNEISVASLDGLRKIYLGGFPKRSWYLEIFLNYNTPNLASMPGSAAHSAQKRIISGVYSKSFILNSKDFEILSNYVIFKEFLPKLEQSVQMNKDVEVLGLSRAFGMDMMSAYLFGLRNGTEFLANDDFRKHWFKLYDVFKHQSPKQREGSEIEQWCLGICKAVEESAADEKSEKHGNRPLTKPVVYNKLLGGLKGKQLDYPTELVLASELLDHTIAGNETTGITLTYVMYELSRRSSLQDALRDELRAIPDSGITDDCPSPSLIPSLVEKLPLLGAILQETLRLYTAAPAPLRRVTPHVSQSSNITIDGYQNIPGGIDISSSAYSLHRNASVFSEPFEWKPDRWLCDDSTAAAPNADNGGAIVNQNDRLACMNRWFWAFGSGGRMCIGSHFASIQLKLAIASIYRNYTTTIVDDEGIEQEDELIAGPVGKKLVLKFARRV